MNSNVSDTYWRDRKNRSETDSGEMFSPLNVAEKSPILGGDSTSKKNNGCLSKRCIVVCGIIIAIAVVSLSVLYMEYYATNDGIPDPEFPPPPSFMPMGLYRKAGVVSNGGPCAQIGVDVLLNGGNAAEAAIATMICDGATCPEYMGIGGGFIMTIYNATTKKVMSIDARETAPLAANSTMFVKDPKTSVHGGLAIAVPGSLRGYSTIYELYGGGVSWESLFMPTIELCEKGMKITKHLETKMKEVEDLIKNDPMLRKTFFNEKTGRVKRAGRTYKLPELARTMKIVAKEGVDAFYNGSLTSKLLKDLEKINSIITKEDLASYKVEVEEAFSVKLFNGQRIHAGPPPGSGIILAYILRIMEGLLPAPNPGLDAHRMIEAFKYGYAERTLLGDHKFINVSEIFRKVQSDSYIDSIRKKISDCSTSTDPKYYGADFHMPDSHGTANIVVIDSMGNTAVGTNTINTLFGCGIMSPSTGIILNNEMDDFSTPGVANHYGIPSSPANFIAPGKRPLSSMCPAVITDKNGDFVLAAGAAGGSKITLATSYLTALKLWYNTTLKEAIDKPRIYHQLMPMEVQYELGTTRDVVQKLKDIGHTVSRLKYPGVSGASAIARTPSGMIEAMPDWRRPGNASGY